MSVIDLATVKAFLRVAHGSDDGLLQALLDGAEDEALRFLNRSELPGLPYDLPEDTEPDITTEPDVAPSVVIGVCLLVMADYEADAEDREKLRRSAEVKLQPYRRDMGC